MDEKLFGSKTVGSEYCHINKVTINRLYVDNLSMRTKSFTRKDKLIPSLDKTK